MTGACRGEQQIELEIANLPFGETGIMLHHYRIDQTHSNAYAEWVRQGKPMYPAPGQYAAMKARDDLELLEPPRRGDAAGRQGQARPSPCPYTASRYSSSPRRPSRGRLVCRRAKESPGVIRARRHGRASCLRLLSYRILDNGKAV